MSDVVDVWCGECLVWWMSVWWMSYNLGNHGANGHKMLEWLPDLPGLEEVLGLIPRVV